MRRLFALFVLLAPCAWGQMGAAGGVDYNDSHASSNIADCATATDCWRTWTLTGGYSQTPAKVFAGNGITFVVDANHNVREYNPATNAFVFHPEFGGVISIEAGSDGNIYALANASGGAYWLSRWNGSGWVNLFCCFMGFSMSRGPDGLIVAHNSAGTLWVSSDYGLKFTHQPWCNATSEAAGFLDRSLTPNFYVVCTDGKIWHHDGGKWAQMPGAALGIAFGGTDHDGAPLIYIVGGGNVVYHANGVGNWDKLNSVATGNTIAIADEQHIWYVTGSNVSRFSQYGWTTVAKYTGEIDACLPQFQTACNNSQHHLEFTMTVGNKTVSTTKDWNNVGLPWNVSLSIPQHQAFVEGDIPPKPTHSAKVLCSVLGPLAALAVDEALAGDIKTSESRDIIRWLNYVTWVGPFDSGTNYSGAWDGAVTWNGAEACPGVSVPTCPVYTAAPFNSQFHETWVSANGTPVAKAEALIQIDNAMDGYIAGTASPWAVTQEYYTRNGENVCLPGTKIWTSLRGFDKAAIPPCK